MLTIQQIMDTIIAAIPGGRKQETVDTVKTGDPTQPVTGIVTTFLATQEVIERTVALGANLIITHEPTFYNHLDEVDWLAGDEVYAAKRRLIDEHGIVIWRFHDYWHTHEPDGIMIGVLKQLGWEGYAAAEVPYEEIPPVTLADLAALLKDKLGVVAIKAIGDPALLCRRVGMMVGAAGGRWQIRYLRETQVDVLVCGEIAEWETSEYVRDALRQGQRVALLVVGHAPSEEPGMAYLVDWLRPRFPGVPITHVPAGSPFRYL